MLSDGKAFRLMTTRILQPAADDHHFALVPKEADRWHGDVIGHAYLVATRPTTDNCHHERDHRLSDVGLYNSSGGAAALNEYLNGIVKPVALEWLGIEDEDAAYALSMGTTSPYEKINPDHLEGYHAADMLGYLMMMGSDENCGFSGGNQRVQQVAEEDVHRAWGRIACEWGLPRLASDEGRI